MTATLPPGLSWRRPQRANVDALFEFRVAGNVAAIGVADLTRDDVADEFDEPDYDPEHDGWLVHDAAGAVAGFAWAGRRGVSDHVDVDVLNAPGAAVSEWLWAQVLNRAREQGAAAGHDHVQVDIGIYRDDEPKRAEAATHGFAPATVFHRMRIDHSGVRDDPPTPAGVVVRTGPGDDAFLRAAHAVHQASFAQHFGFAYTPFDDWFALLDSASTHDWGQLEVADIDGEPAGVLIATDQFVADENCGYVRSLGVLEAARGRGLGRLLLERAFARDSCAGRAGTMLHVDTGNTTPALGLYEAAGMRAVLVIDMWQRVLEV